MEQWVTKLWELPCYHRAYEFLDLLNFMYFKPLNMATFLLLLFYFFYFLISVSFGPKCSLSKKQECLKEKNDLSYGDDWCIDGDPLQILLLCIYFVSLSLLDALIAEKRYWKKIQIVNIPHLPHQTCTFPPDLAAWNHRTTWQIHFNGNHLFLFLLFCTWHFFLMAPGKINDYQAKVKLFSCCQILEKRNKIFI